MPTEELTIGQQFPIYQGTGVKIAQIVKKMSVTSPLCMKKFIFRIAVAQQGAFG